MHLAAKQNEIKIKILHVDRIYLHLPRNSQGIVGRVRGTVNESFLIYIALWPPDQIITAMVLNEILQVLFEKQL